MNGIVLPKAKSTGAHGHGRWWQRLFAIVADNRLFFLVVIAPTLVYAAYNYLVAADQYETSVDFVVRKAEGNNSSSELGQVMGFSLGASATSSDAYVVQEYLLSHDAVDRLKRENDLVAKFRRSGIDLPSRIWGSNPPPERLLKFYRRQVKIAQDDTSGMSHMTVHTFRPQDSYELAAKLLQMGEEQINRINQRTYQDQIASAKRELQEADRQLIDVQVQLTAYRRNQHDLDPGDTGRAQVTLVTNLTANLVAARAQLQAMQGAIHPSSPQYQALVRQVQALEAQVAGQTSRIAGPDHSVATRLSDYEQLVIKREQIAKVYAAAATRYETSQAEAKRKQLYLIRVDEPNVPVKSEYPKRGQSVLTVFAMLFILYAIGWLLWAGVKEHSL